MKAPSILLVELVAGIDDLEIDLRSLRQIDTILDDEVALSHLRPERQRHHCKVPPDAQRRHLLGAERFDLLTLVAGSATHGESPLVNATRPSWAPRSMCVRRTHFLAVRGGPCRSARRIS